MKKKDLEQAPLTPLEEWIEVAGDKWHFAKDILGEHIEDKALNSWEEGLVTIQKDMDLIKNKRSDNNENDIFLEDLENIYTQCQHLFNQYNDFTKKFNRVGISDADTSTEKKIEEKNDGRLDFKKSKSDWSPPKDAIKPGKHKLPPLPYAYDALEPYIDKETMKLHHDIHHKSYVDGLNKAELNMLEARKTNNFDLIRHWEREAAFNGAGHYLHTIFWDVMGPQGGRKPKGALLDQITHDFGSFKAFKKHFTEAAKKVEGPGWAILVWSPRSHRLTILQAEKHQNLSQWDVVPLLVLDVWEHAYYLNYKTDKDKYIDNWWNIVNWDEVSDRFNKAEKLRWKPY